MNKTGQLGGCVGNFLGSLLKTGLLLMKNMLEPIAKNDLIPLGLTAVAAATDTAIHKKMFGSGVTILIISNEEMNDIMKILKSLEESDLLIKGVSKTIKNEEKEQQEGFLWILLGTLGPSLLGKLLTSKGTIRAGEGSTATSQGQCTIRTSQVF